MLEVIHTGIYNFDLIQAIVERLPYTVNDYFKKTDHSFVILSDGELVIQSHREGQNLLKIISNRILKITKMWEEDIEFSERNFRGWRVFSGPNYPQKDIETIHELSYYPASVGKSWKSSRGRDDLADYLFPLSCYWNDFVSKYSVNPALVEIAGKSLKSGYTKEKLVKEYGEELVNKAFGRKLNPIEVFNNEQIQKEFENAWQMKRTEEKTSDFWSWKDKARREFQETCKNLQDKYIVA